MSLHDFSEKLSFTQKRWLSAPARWSPATGGGGGTLAPWLAPLLEARGIQGDAAIARYLDPSLRDLADPEAMADMSTAVARIMRALDRREAITVYGDYDVDGTCAAAVLVEFLRAVGGQARYYIPDRRAEGYGLNAAAITALAASTQLLIAADCGITAHAEVALARSQGMDVIIVDHHQVPDTLPDAVAALNPQRNDCAYPFKGMCAAGVAFLLVVALRRACREAGRFVGRPEPDVRSLLDLVAVATVADMVPMQQTNRILVAAGLRRMAHAARPGLAALCQVSKLRPDQVTATDCGFRLGPRINARGRMDDATLAVDMLLTQDPAQALAMAEVLDGANAERRAVEKATVEAAVAQVEANGWQDDAALVVHDPTWHPGVLGLVATRLTGRYGVAALVIGEGGKGSGRTCEGLNLHAALSSIAPLMLRFGGHVAAAGVTVAPEGVDALRAGFVQAVQEQLGKPPYTRWLRPDVRLEAAGMHLDTVAAVECLAPFGQGNAQPLFVAHNLQVKQRRMIKDSHLKLTLGQGTDAIGFGMGALHDDLPEAVDAAFYLERNVYNGRVTVQLRLQDLRPATQG